MIEVIQFKPEDLFAIEKRPQTAGVVIEATFEDAVRISRLPCSYSIFSEHGRLLAVGGVIPRWTGRGEGWAVFAPRVREYLPEITQVAKAILGAVEINRVEVAVACDFVKGHEWAKKLGFKLEAEKLEAYDSLGNDCAIYARIRKPKEKT